MGTTKTIGVDGLPCSFWKEYCQDLALFVTTVINMSIKTGTYPSLFMDAIAVLEEGGQKGQGGPGFLSTHLSSASTFQGPGNSCY